MKRALTRPVIVGPGLPDQTHHLRLKGGGYDIGLILCDSAGRKNPMAISRERLMTSSLKISEGNPKYSDMEMPFTPMAQEDWQGGRGNERYEDDVTRYLDGRNINSSFDGKLFLGPQMGLSKGYRNIQYNIGGSVYWQPMIPGGRRYLAVRFQADASFTADDILILVKKAGAPNDVLTIRLRQDDAGDPGTVMATKTLAVASVDDVLGIWRAFCGYAQALTANSYYWIEVYGSASDNSRNHWKVGVDADPPSSVTKESSNGTSWTSSGVNLYWQLRDADDFPDRVFLFDYKGAVYLLFDYDDASPELFLNGDRGSADSNTGNLTRLNDGSKSWVSNEHAGKVVYIVGGPGSLEEQPWRVITGNEATYLNVSPAWKIEHTTATDYVILGVDKWQQVDVLGTNHIYDFEIIDDVLWLARGDAVKMRRVRGYNNAGAWTDEGADLTGDIQAARIRLVNHNDTDIGKRQIWRALNDAVQISRADVVAWGTDPTFGTGVPVGDKTDKINYLIEYVDPVLGQKILWVLKKGSIWAIKDDIPDMVPLKEMRTVMSDNNARAALVHDLFLYFTLGQGIERFYNDLLDDVGPNRDRGMPIGQQGPIYHLIGYPGRYFCCVNAGTTGYSSIHMDNGNGWHPFYQADELGQPITKMHIQVIPGTSPDRLWFVEGNTVKWLPLPSEAIDPTNDVNYPYTHEGVVITSRMYAGMMDIMKLYDSLKIMADELDEDVCWIEADYKVDTEGGSWIAFPYLYDTSPSQEINLVGKGEDSITGKYLLVRLRLNTSDHFKTPVVRATVANTISRLPTKFGYVASVRFDLESIDLNGEPDDYYEDGLQKVLDLDELAESLTVLEMSHQLRLFNGLRIFIEAPNLTPLKDSDTGEIESYLGTLAITQVLRAEDVE